VKARHITCAAQIITLVSSSYHPSPLCVHCACTYGFLLFTTTRFRHSFELSQRSIPEHFFLARYHSLSLCTYESRTPSVFLHSYVSPVFCIAFAVEQYGRNKDKGKAREVNSTPNRGVTSPPAESRKEPSVNDTLRTINGHRTVNDSGTRDGPEPSLHSPVSQKTSGSPGPSNNARASTDAITHVSLSQSHASTDTFLRIMLSQRLAELASANAEGLLEYVVLMKQISDLGD
jgi:hypothetical protein